VVDEAGVGAVGLVLHAGRGEGSALPGLDGPTAAAEGDERDEQDRCERPPSD
jgi:hypothetical protein